MLNNSSNFAHSISDPDRPTKTSSQVMGNRRSSEQRRFRGNGQPFAPGRTRGYSEASSYGNGTEVAIGHPTIAAAEVATEEVVAGT